jgi:hypothetical protein
MCYVLVEVGTLVDRQFQYKVVLTSFVSHLESLEHNFLIEVQQTVLSFFE